MKKWIKDNRVTEEFKEELKNKGIIDINGYRYVEGEIFGRFVVRRISLSKMKEINTTGQTNINDFDLVDHESSKVFEETALHTI